ncbi:nitroreductase family protein [Coralloluteibacterium thermophilus]|uniref:Putative NAD(P)H nitroreductase n=1 Tax=Coralloluteibacterium thermophilum TaxID=2707049 RepID=A0ABV9NM89_9GAMM
MPHSVQGALGRLLSRRSVPSRLLAAPGPDAAQLRRMLEAASRVPDHGNLAPWRFIAIDGDARLALGERLAARARVRDPGAPDAVVEKARRRFAQAPLVVAVVCRPLRDHKVPVIEQQLTTGCVCFALLQAADALGFGAQWLTGWAAYDRPFLTELGLAPDEELLGFVHIGTPTEVVPDRERPDPDARLSAWRPL